MAQLVEHRTFNARGPNGVESSSLSGCTENGILFRYICTHSSMVELPALNRRVEGSSPSGCTENMTL